MERCKDCGDPVEVTNGVVAGCKCTLGNVKACQKANEKQKMKFRFWANCPCCKRKINVYQSETKGKLELAISTKICEGCNKEDDGTIKWHEASSMVLCSDCA